MKACAGPILLTAALGIAGSAGPALAQGCSMCATYVNDSDPVAGAMKMSIVFLMAMPFTMLATVGGWFYWMYRGRNVAALEGMNLHGEEEL